MSDRTIAFYRGKDDELRVKIMAPGIDDLSAPIDDPIEFIRQVAYAAELEADDAQIPDSLVISVAPGS